MEGVIKVRELGKVYRVKHKPAGVGASLRALFAPHWHDYEALSNLNFDVETGEIVGFIGPNGAGKSTTIKILTGILYPTSGEALVLGLVPSQKRRELAYQIATVFGQRPQLWYHLPAIDSLQLMARVYDLDRKQAALRIAQLAEAFDIEDLLEVPVRKLSLGQRMRCEVAASLLHRPRVLLLDEPSIGLDVVAKERIRDMVGYMNREERVSVLLTSHDAGDIESLCSRVLVINRGRLALESSVPALRRDYLRVKLVDVHYAEPVATDFAIPGAEVTAHDGTRLSLRVDTGQTSIQRVLTALGAPASIVDVAITDPPLEDVIRAIYRGVRLAPEGAQP